MNALEQTQTLHGTAIYKTTPNHLTVSGPCGGVDSFRRLGEKSDAPSRNHEATWNSGGPRTQVSFGFRWFQSRWRRLIYKPPNLGMVMCTSTSLKCQKTSTAWGERAPDLSPLAHTWLGAWLSRARS